MLKTTYDDQLRLTEDYQKVMGVIKHLQDTNTLEYGQGYCLSMCDILYTLLKQQGIKSRLVECKLTVTGYNPPFLHVIGSDDERNRSNGNIDTHVILITDTAIPMIIDASIGNIAMGREQYIVERVNGADVETIAEHVINGTTWLYTLKLSHRLPRVHEQSIVERMTTDRTIFKNLSLLKILVIVALTISAFNAIRGGYDFYQVYVDDTNYWGPSHMKKLVEKVEHLEELVKKPVEQR